MAGGEPIARRIPGKLAIYRVLAPSLQEEIYNLRVVDPYDGRNKAIVLLCLQGYTTPQINKITVHDLRLDLGMIYTRTYVSPVDKPTGELIKDYLQHRKQRGQTASLFTTELGNPLSPTKMREALSAYLFQRLGLDLDSEDLTRTFLWMLWTRLGRPPRVRMGPRNRQNRFRGLLVNFAQIEAEGRLRVIE